jgi:uncharacterized protein YraI
MKKYKKSLIIVIILGCLLILKCLAGIVIKNENLNNSIDEMQNVINNEIQFYEMTEEEIIELKTAEIIEQNEIDEQNLEQEVEDEGFELQGDIAYEGDKARSWNVTLGNYKGLTYYSQIDNRWRNKRYSSTGNASQTIGSSGCGPTSASMIVTACKGAITPDVMSDLFVKYGYRSANNGTYWSAFRAIADEFDIGYSETTNFQRAIELLRNNNYVVASVGNGLFTTGGHFIVLTGIDGDTIKIYDPYLYAGKFETSTRRGKVTVVGNTVYVSVQNFRNYANAKGFFCYKHDENVQENNVKPVVVQPYTRYVKANGGLNIRSSPNGNRIGAIRNGEQITVYETLENWSRIGNGRWVSSEYLVSSLSSYTDYVHSNKYLAGRYKVTASILNVRNGPSTNYSSKRYYQLSSNARLQNRRLGGECNGYRRGVVFTVSKIINNWGYSPSGWVCLDYCYKY